MSKAIELADKWKMTSQKDMDDFPLMVMQFADDMAEELRSQDAELREWKEKAAKWLSSPDAAKKFEGYRSLAQQLYEVSQDRDALQAKLRELEGQKPNDWYYDWMGRRYYFPDEQSAIACAKSNTDAWQLKTKQFKNIQVHGLYAQPIIVNEPSISGTPEGWLLVPLEPTYWMLEAANSREDMEPLNSWGKVVPATHSEIYKAMLAAAPLYKENNNGA